MRCVGYLVALCLLCASTTPRRAAHEHDHPHDAIAAVKALAKLAARRHDGQRPVRVVGLDAFALIASAPPHPPPRFGVEIVHASPTQHRVVPRIAHAARGPPIG